MSEDPYYLNLRRQIENFWPADSYSIESLSSLEDVWIAPCEVSLNGETVSLETQLLFDQAITIGLPSLKALQLLIGESAGVEVGIQADIFPVFAATVGPVRITIRVDSTLLRPVERIDDGRPRFRELPDTPLNVSIGEVIASFDLNGSVAIETDYSVSLPPAMIGHTGIVIEADRARLILSERDELAIAGEIPAGGRGVFLDGVAIYFPEDLSVAVPSDVTIENCLIGTGGISGRFTGNWNPQLGPDGRHFVENGAGELFGIPFGLRSVELEFVDNVPIKTEIRGQLFVPYFDKAVDVELRLALDGQIAVTLSTSSGEVSVTREELLELRMRSLSISVQEDGTSALIVSGGLTPLLQSSEGLQWPSLDVTDLYLDSNGKFTIKEAWLDLKELATLDLWGFHFELRRIGIGYEQENDKLWIDLSGGLRLIEQIPVALDVEGFRITWPRTLLGNVTQPLTIEDIQDAASQLEVSFAGIYLFFGVPDAVEFEGLIRFFKEAQLVGFAGDMALRVPASGFGAEAGLLIGLSFEPLFPFLYVYFGVELPAGIPLGQSGLALKGALGMFGLNVVPDKTPDQNWYYDWYKRGPIVGAHPTNKWVPQKDALALGVGVTITTTDGYVKGTRGLIVLAIPGPILIIEGRALILNGLQPNAEPPLRALAVFDGGAGTVQFNVEAEATLIADLLKAYGMLEAFFDFNDLTNWHLYLGQDTPRDRRIRADILKLDDKFLFRADAYLMIDMVNAGTLRSRIGASIGFEPKVPKIDPLEVEFAATLEGDGIVTARPEQFSGELELSASIKLSALGVSVRLSADADFLTEGPRPFKVGAHVSVEAELPAPLDPVKATVEFEWQAPELPGVESPLEAIDIHSRLGPLGAGFTENALKAPNKIYDFREINGAWEPLAKDSPVVEVDSKPIICFKQKMNSDVTTFARHPSGETFHYDVGLFQFFPTLTTIKLYEHLKDNRRWSGRDDDWTLIASTDSADNKTFPGVWLVNADPDHAEAPASRQVQLWTDNPLALTSRALGSGYTKFLGAIQPGKALAARMLDDYPGLMKCEYTKARQVCVDFKEAEHLTIERDECWEYRQLHICATVRPIRIRAADGSRLRAAGSDLIDDISEIIRNASAGLFDRLLGRDRAETCLFVDGDVNIGFRERVKKVRIVFCRPSKLKETEIQTRVTARRGIRTKGELESAGLGAGTEITLKDIRDCNVRVSADLIVSEQEWVLESDEGFDCIHIVRMDQFGIKEICYTTIAEVARARRAIDECKQNSDLPANDITLKPGAYYRLDVTTRVAGELNLDDLPFDDESPVGQMLTSAYHALEDALTAQIPLPRMRQQTCFFQTKTPPTNLRPYIKWTHPSHQFERFFYGDDIVIRFLRSSLEEMFGAPFAVEARVEDVQGNTLEGLNTTWSQARSSTLFPEESVWQAHRSSLDWPESDNSRDNLLCVKFTAGAKGLSPSSRYRLEIVGVGRSNAWNKQVLFSSTFTTSKFKSFKELIASHAGQRSVAARHNVNSDSASVEDLQLSCRLLARNVWDLDRAEVDYRFETLSGGRKGLEDAKLAQRETAASHEAKFRAICDRLGDLYFQQPLDKLEVFVMRERNTAVALWIKSPETLDIRLGVFENPGTPGSTPLDHTGRIEITLERVAPARRSIGIIVVPNSDGTQVVVLPSSRRPFERGRYLLHLTYHRDYGDELTSSDHRYDRPIESTAGNHDPIPQQLVITI